MTPSYTLGLIFIVLVSFIWAAASILVQFLYQDYNFNSPFLLTYIGTSLFVILIPSRLIWERQQRCQTKSYRSVSSEDDENEEGRQIGSDDEDEIVTIIPWRNSEMQLHQREINEEMEHSNLDLSGNSRNSHDNEPDALPSTELSPFSIGSSDGEEKQKMLSHIDHIKISSRIAPIWFLSNYCYNLSLSYTSITASTVLSSTGSVFTFLFAFSCGDEAFTKWKCIGVLLTFFGSLLTSIHDSASDASDDNSSIDDDQSKLRFWGDVAGVVAAVGYGGYTVLIRVLCPSDEKYMSMQLLLGYIGIVNMTLLCPIAIWIVLNEIGPNDNSQYQQDDSIPTDIQPHLTWFIFGCIVVKGLTDNVLSDYLWARAIILTSATVATVGLGLTIPLALASDMFLMDRNDVWSMESVTGACLVLVGFIFVNVGENVDIE